MKTKQTILFITSLTLLISCLLPLPVCAGSDRPQITGQDRKEMAAKEAQQGKEQKVVRVGWYESQYCYRDKNDRRCGVAYEYQRAIAAHTGWKYEYVEDSWPNLMQMLLDGEIDLLSDVSYTEERAGRILYPDIPMGYEGYYLYIDIDNNDISADDFSSFEGKRLGVNKGSIQEDFLKGWLDKRGINAEIVEMTVNSDEALKQLAYGKIDAYAGIDSTGSVKRCIPVCKIGNSEYFFAVNKERTDLLVELNDALSAIQDEDPYFGVRLVDKLLEYTKTDAYLVSNQAKWVKQHGPIRFGYRDRYLPFCSYDSAAGDVTGALSDFLHHAGTCIQNAQIEFETVPYATTSEALEALKKDEVCCVFPVNLSLYDCEELGILTTNPVMETEMYAVMKKSDNLGILKNSSVNVAVNEGNINYTTFIMDNYPEWTIVYYPGVDECMHEVAAGRADYTLISDYRAGEIEDLLDKYSLMTMSTGEKMGYSIAVREEEKTCYAILNKIVNLTGSDYMDASLAYFSYFNREESAGKVMKDHWIAVLAVISAVFLAVIIYLMNQLKKVRLVIESHDFEESFKEDGKP